MTRSMAGVLLLFALPFAVLRAGTISVFTDGASFVSAVGSSPLGQENFAGFTNANIDGNDNIALPGGLTVTVGFLDAGRIVNNGPIPGGNNVDALESTFTVSTSGQNYVGFEYNLEARNTGNPISTATQVEFTYAGNSYLEPLSGFFGIYSSQPLSSTGINAFGWSTPGGGSQVVNDGPAYVDNVLYAGGPGISASNPLLPDEICSPGASCGNGGCSILGIGCFVWDLVTGTNPGLIGNLGTWIDPPAANEYTYQTLDGSLFTSIAGFPTGFSSPFDVSSGGVDYGLFEPGQTLTFPDGGVSSFEISGIDPSVDGSNPTAFPLEVSMNTSGAEVEATAFDQSASTPEPASWTLCALAFSGQFGYLWRRWNRRRSQNA